MSATWQLAINSLVAKRGRSLVLLLSVALAASLVVAAAAVLGTLGKSIRQNMGQMVGLADLSVIASPGGSLDASILDTIAAQPQVVRAAPRYEIGINLRQPRGGRHQGVLLTGIDPLHDPEVFPLRISQGRHVQRPGEILVDNTLAQKLDVEVGQIIQADTRAGEDAVQAPLTVVGIYQRPRLAVLQSRTALVTLEQVYELARVSDVLTEVGLQLAPGSDAEHVRAQLEQQLPSVAQLQTPASASARINNAVRTAQLLLRIVTMLVFLSAGFIILTTQTTGVVERQRELAVLRCIGSPRWQIAGAQLLAGLLVSTLGAALGVPLGLALAYQLYSRHAQALEAGFDYNLQGVLWAAGASIFAGLLGAAYPAFKAASISPLQALVARAHPPRARALIACLLVGLAAAGLQPLIMSLPIDVNDMLDVYTHGGMPLTFVGYFLLAPVVLVLVSLVAAPVIATLLRVPRPLLTQSLRATPFRHGFTAGALMVSLAMLVGIWTSGRSVMTGWFENLRMPDGFVHSWWSLWPSQVQALEDAPGITRICPVTAFPVRAGEARMGPEWVTPPPILFVSCDLPAFFAMTDLQWIEGDPESALQRLAEGQAVLVSREFLVAHGIGLGARLKLYTPARGYVDFDVVGVVGSTGMEVAVQFFGIHRAYGQAAMSSVFGTRETARDYFNVTATNLVLLSFDPAVDDRTIGRQVREAVPAIGTIPGVSSGSSRAIRRVAREASQRMMAVASSIAIVTLLIASAGVGNLILANVAARRFEYGVLRAVGSGRFLLARLVIAETLVIALTGCVVGWMLGIQLALIARGFHQRLLGITYAPDLQWDVVLAGGGLLITAACLATLPALFSLTCAHPRTLLAAGRMG